MMNKHLTILVSSLAAVTLLAGCGAKTSSSKHAVHHERTSKAALPNHQAAASATEPTPTTLVAPGPATLQLARAQVVLPAGATPTSHSLTTPVTGTLAPAGHRSVAVTAAVPTTQAPTASTATAAKPVQVTSPSPQFPVTQLTADRLSQQQTFGLYAWYTSHYVTNEATPVAARGLTVTAMQPGAQTAVLPAGTNNTYYLVYGATPANGEWVNYYAQGTASQGNPAPVYIYHQDQWQAYNVNQMVNAANQNNGAGYVNRVANQVHFYDER